MTIIEYEFIEFTKWLLLNISSLVHMLDMSSSPQAGVVQPLQMDTQTSTSGNYIAPLLLVCFFLKLHEQKKYKTKSHFSGTTFMVLECERWRLNWIPDSAVSNQSPQCKFNLFITVFQLIFGCLLIGKKTNQTTLHTMYCYTLFFEFLLLQPNCQLANNKLADYIAIFVL